MSFAHNRRDVLLEIATQTRRVIDDGSYRLYGDTYRLHTQQSVQGTRFYPPNAHSNWFSPPSRSQTRRAAHISIHEATTIEGARWLFDTLRPPNKVGVLSFASATKPGGGFMNGAQAQEESLARSSTLYPTLSTSTAEKFYQLHRNQPHNPYYTHA